MAADKHEALIRAYIDEVFDGHRTDALEKYWDDDLTSHWLGMETIHGLPAWRAAMGGFLAAFPDAAYTLDDMLFAGDRGVWRGHWQATQQGEWQGIAASGRKDHRLHADAAPLSLTWRSMRSNSLSMGSSSGYRAHTARA